MRVRFHMEKMDYTSLVLFLSFICICLAAMRRKRRLPPGPFPLPVVGNLFQLDAKLHKVLSDVAKIYGPLMSLKLGNMTTVIASSPEMARAILQYNDKSLSGRKVPGALRGHENYSVIWSQNSPRWRDMRKMYNTELFLHQRLVSSQSLRRRKVEELLAYVDDTCKNRGEIDIGQIAFSTVLNLLSNTAFSEDLTRLGSNYAQDFKAIVSQIVEEPSKPNFADFFPILSVLDPQGMRRRMSGHLGKIDKIFDKLIEQRLQFRDLGTVSSSYDFLDTMLDYVQADGSKLSDTAIKASLKDIFIAGTDTTSSSTEWAMVELLRNVDVMAKAQSEIRAAIGEDEPIEEEVIDSLPYFRALVKETFRLHPPVPFLIPHRADSTVEIASFIVPKNAQVLVNVYAMGRDPTVWEQPALFMPERFLSSDMDFRGRDFELIPFGAGRRICPGLPLAYRMVYLMLASLIHAFDWKLPEGLKPEEMDMEEKFGVTLRKNIPLKAIPFKT